MSGTSPSNIQISTSPKESNNLSLPPIRTIENFIKDIQAREHVTVPSDPKELALALNDLGSQVKKILPSSQFSKFDDAISKLSVNDQYVALFYIKSSIDKAKKEVTAFTDMLTSLVS